jgi:hypothetical protein
MHIESKHPTFTLPRFWCVYLLAMDDFTSCIVVKIQGLTTLVVQHLLKLGVLIDSFIDDIRVTFSSIIESIQDLDPTTHVFSGWYVVYLSNV